MPNPSFSTGPESEIGRELKPSELRPEMVVVVMKEGGNWAATFWVTWVGTEHIAFLAGLTHTTLVLFREGDKLTDGTGAVMKTYEYLGEI